MVWYHAHISRRIATWRLVDQSLRLGDTALFVCSPPRVKRVLPDLLRQQFRHNSTLRGGARHELPIDQIAAIIEVVVKQHMTGASLSKSCEKVGYYEDEDGELQFDPLRVIDEAVFQRHPSSAGVDAARQVADAMSGRHASPPLSDPIVLAAAKASFFELFQAVAPHLDGASARPKQHGPRSRNTTGLWVTGSGNRQYNQV